MYNAHVHCKHTYITYVCILYIQMYATIFHYVCSFLLVLSGAVCVCVCVCTRARVRVCVFLFVYAIQHLWVTLKGVIHGHISVALRVHTPQLNLLLLNTIILLTNATKFSVAGIFCARGQNMKSAPPCCKGIEALAQVSYKYPSMHFSAFLFVA